MTGSIHGSSGALPVNPIQDSQGPSQLPSPTDLLSARFSTPTNSTPAATKALLSETNATNAEALPFSNLQSAAGAVGTALQSIIK